MLLTDSDGHDDGLKFCMASPEKYVMAEDYVLIVIYGAATDSEPLLNSLQQ